MRLPATVLILLSLLLFIPFTACEPKSEVDHLAIARAMEAQLGAPGDYSDPGYNQVTEELQLVQTGDSGWDEAQAWIKVIQKGRQDALFRRNEAPEVQEGGFHASKPAAGEGGGGGSEKGSWTAAGWLPYNDVPTNPGASTGASSGAKASQTASAGNSSKCKKGPVILYGTSWCGVCAEARAHFRSKGVAFTDKDVEKDASAMAEMKRKAPAASSYPIIDLGGEIMPGFSASAIDRKLCL